MEKIAKALVTEVDAWNEETDLKEALEALNDTLEDISGGSAAPLFGSFVCGMADAADPSQDTDAFIKTILLGAYEEFFDTSGAKPGGKSMMDAIYPATEVIRSADTSATAPSAIPTLAPYPLPCSTKVWQKAMPFNDVLIY